MNSRKKQTVAVAMATALGVSAMMSAVTVYAQEEDPATAITQESTQDDTPVSEQGLPASEQPQKLNTNSLSSGKPIIQSSANKAFTDSDEARQAIQTALDSYPVSNETTQEELQDFLNREFVDTGKLLSIFVNELNKTEATSDSAGIIVTTVKFIINGGGFSFGYRFTIPHLPKAGEVAIDKANFPDDVFRQYVSDNFDTVSDGVLSQEEISKVTSIEITNNSNLKSLKGIEYFAALQLLNCYNTGIGSLNVGNNSDLITLDCSGTGITELDVSNNAALQYLYCYNTGISSLDISNNAAMWSLFCYNTPLAYLNLGNKQVLDYIASPSVIDFTVTSDFFDMTQAFAGIDMSKVTNITGAKLNGNDLTGYQVGTPITYTYDCGTNKGNPVKLNVTLNLSKSDSKIIIGSNLNMEYSGKPYEIPEIKREGSKGEFTFTYSAYINGSYEPIATAPTNVGKYAVYIELAEDEYHEGAVIERTYFEITQAKNSWTNELAIKDWKENEKANKPTATAKFGDAVFTYSASENGVYTSEVPVKAGTWYVRAIVTGTENYTGLESIRAFTIQEQDKHAPENPKDDPANHDKQPKDENGNTVKPSGSVQTGDNSQTGLLATLTMLSAGCIALLAGKKRKKMKPHHFKHGMQTYMMYSKWS